MTHPTNLTHGAASGGIFRDGYATVTVHELQTSDLEGAAVHGFNDESIGKISALKVGTDGQINEAVIDVGGFLGIGAHSVLLPFSDLTVLRATNGTNLRVHLDTTKERLKAMPHHAH